MEWILWLNAILFGIFFALYAVVFIMRSRYASDQKESDKQYGRKKSIAFKDAKANRNIAAENAALVFINMMLYSLSLYPDFGFHTRADGFVVNAVRWLFYTISCTLLALTIAILLRHERYYRYLAAILVAATLFSGYCVSLIPIEDARLTFYLFGFVPFFAALYIVIFKRRVTANWAFWVLIVWVGVTWTIYPIVFLLGHAMYRAISYKSEVLAYSIVDWFSKIGFSLFSVLAYNKFVPHSSKPSASATSTGVSSTSSGGVRGRAGGV